MGRGLANSIRNKYPNVFDGYIKACEQGKFMPGDAVKVDCFDGVIVFSMATQEFYRSKGVRPGIEYASLDWIRDSLNKVGVLMKDSGLPDLALPELGCNNGGLKWYKVKPVIEQFEKESEINVTIYRL